MLHQHRHGPRRGRRHLRRRRPTLTVYVVDWTPEKLPLFLEGVARPPRDWDSVPPGTLVGVAALERGPVGLPRRLSGPSRPSMTLRRHCRTPVSGVRRPGRGRREDADREGRTPGRRRRPGRRAPRPGSCTRPGGVQLAVGEHLLDEQRVTRVVLHEQDRRVQIPQRGLGVRRGSDLLEGIPEMPTGIGEVPTGDSVSPTSVRRHGSSGLIVRKHRRAARTRAVDPAPGPTGRSRPPGRADG
ncbi:hypothetical protein SBADM41S_05050 [Streptomyces badius]